MFDILRRCHQRFRSSLKAGALGSLALVALSLAACESEITLPQEPVFEEGEITLDASSPVEFVHLDLANGTQITSADPANSTDWHLGLRRFSVRLNGGVSGPGTVAGYGVANRAGATEDQITALTPDDGRAAFDAVTEADIPDADMFSEDGLAPDPGSTWFGFDGQLGTLVANPGAAWKVQESSGRGYSIFRVSALQMQGQRPLGAEVEYRRHDPGGSLGETATAVADLTRGPAFVSFAGLPTPQAQGCDWDIGLSPDLTIAINVACGAGTFPLDATEDFAAQLRADDAPEYAGFLSVIAGPFPASIDDASGVFWYGIQGNNRMWPTYNVFLVRAGEDVYKVQVFDYYDATGASGFPSVRFKRLR